MSDRLDRALRERPISTRIGIFGTFIAFTLGGAYVRDAMAPVMSEGYKDIGRSIEYVAIKAQGKKTNEEIKAEAQAIGGRVLEAVASDDQILRDYEFHLKTAPETKLAVMPLKERDNTPTGDLVVLLERSYGTDDKNWDMRIRGSVKLDNRELGETNWRNDVTLQDISQVHLGEYRCHKSGHCDPVSLTTLYRDGNSWIESGKFKDYARLRANPHEGDHYLDNPAPEELWDQLLPPQ